MPLCKHCKTQVSRHSQLCDAAGIFVAFWCGDEACEREIKRPYNPRIFQQWYDADKPDVEYPEDYDEG